MAVVYEPVHVDLERPVALKVLGGHAAPDSNGRRRFLKALSPDGRTLALSDRAVGIALISAARGTLAARLNSALDDAEGPARAFAYSPDGRMLAVGTSQGQIHLWSVDEPAAHPLGLPNHSGMVTALAFDPTGRYLATNGSGKLVGIWDLRRIQQALESLGLSR